MDKTYKPESLSLKGRNGDDLTKLEITKIPIRNFADHLYQESGRTEHSLTLLSADGLGNI
ncbi:hypothetical protein Smp_150620 [Schistosoma mansoni]|uniref:hypothetical protein n=1 Tax=Schistosoma mansoni TaxID=6183 RepID=UPI0001A634FB|nr:hypothetical protein Smp_150620 [Schistosoma mansoni]|eukprot:XP_018646070.1 hypothetical protein Smp_150620 [Schistosoma mansoni]